MFFRFDCPATPVDVEPGIQQDFIIDVDLGLTEISIGEELEAWSLGVRVSGAEVVSATLHDLTVSTVFDHDLNPITPPMDPHPKDLEVGGGFSRTTLASSATAVSGVVLDVQKKMYLHPNSTETVLRLTLTATTPSVGSTAEIALAFEDGIVGDGQPVRNLVTVDSLPYRPRLEECRFTLRGVAPAVGAFIRGDANGNGRLNLADAVWILNELFRGGPPTTCTDSPDVNGDGITNTSDVVYIIVHQVQGGPSPSAPFPGCGTDPGSTEESCPQGSTSCP